MRLTETAAAKAYREHAEQLTASFTMPVVEISDDLDVEDLCMMVRDLDRLRYHIEDMFGYRPYIISDPGAGVGFDRPAATALRAVADWVTGQMRQCYEALKRKEPTDLLERKERLNALIVMAVERSDQDALERYAEEAKSLR